MEDKNNDKEKKTDVTFEDDEDNEDLEDNSSKYENDSETDQSDLGDLPGDAVDRDDDIDEPFISQVQWPQSFR